MHYNSTGNIIYFKRTRVLLDIKPQSTLCVRYVAGIFDTF